LNRVIAIEIRAPDSLEELDTLRPRARALDGHFDSIPATIVWSTLDTAILTVLDSTTGSTLVNHPGTTSGRLLARTGTLFSNPLLIRTLAAADTVYATPPTRVADTVHLSVDSLSDSLAVLIADTLQSASGGDSTVPLADRPVTYSITFPTAPGPVTLVTSDTARTLVTSDTVASGSLGIASVKLRLIAGPVPDSVLVTASARRAVGTPVPGSPVTFVVRFLP